MSVRQRALEAVFEAFPFLLRPEERAHLRTAKFGRKDAYPDPRCTINDEIYRGRRCGRGHAVSTNLVYCQMLVGCEDGPDVLVTRAFGEPCKEAFAWPEVFAAWDARQAGAPVQGRLL